MIKKELLNAMATSGVKKMILNGLSNVRKKLWYGNVLAVEVLAQLVNLTLFFSLLKGINLILLVLFLDVGVD
jgi:hypothetical protein